MLSDITKIYLNNIDGDKEYILTLLNYSVLITLVVGRLHPSREMQICLMNP